MKFTLLFFVYVFFLLGGLFFLTWAHEDAHKQACIYRNGSVKEMSIAPWHAFTTCSVGPTAQDSEIEAKGYPAHVLFLFFTTGLFLASLPYLYED